MSRWWSVPAAAAYFYFGWFYADAVVRRIPMRGASREGRGMAALFVATVWLFYVVARVAIKLAEW